MSQGIALLKEDLPKLKQILDTIEKDQLAAPFLQPVDW